MSGTSSEPSGMDWIFSYRGCEFQCSVEATRSETYLPHVQYRSGVAGIEQIALPVDTEPYASVAEARRHAEQQAIRWTHDRSGDGQGRF